NGLLVTLLTIRGGRMKIAKNSVASFHYTLTDDANQTLDTSAGGEPLVYLHGFSNIIPGLEEALEGKSQGDKFKVTIPAEKAYGEHREEMVQSTPIEQFPDRDQVKVGSRFRAQSQMGPVVLTVVEVNDTEVVV